MASTASSPAFSAPPSRPRADALGPVSCRLAESAAERRVHRAIRHQVFVAEQRIFAGSDEDEHDGGGALAVLGRCGARAAGTVRLYPLDESGLWKGDRLAVLRALRGCHVAAPLVRFAVASAARRGGHTMVARIQTPNVPFFESLGWRADGATGPYLGLSHQPMAIDLSPRDP